MNVINIKKINKLLEEDKDKNQSELSRFIGMQSPNLSSALRGKRPLPMGHIFEIAEYFNIDNAKELTTSYSESITDTTDSNEVQEIK